MGEYLSINYLGVFIFWQVFTHVAFVFKNLSAYTFFSAYHGVRAFAFLDQSSQTFI